MYLSVPSYRSLTTSAHNALLLLPLPPPPPHTHTHLHINDYFYNNQTFHSNYRDKDVWFVWNQPEEEHDGKVQMVRRGTTGMYGCVRGGWGGGIAGDRLAGENCDADPLIKMDVLPFCFKCN